MEDSTAALAAAIGGRVRRERQAQNLTLDHLAEAAGVSRRMLVNVEQGAANPSVGTLLRLSDALGVGLPSLVEVPKQQGMDIVRSGQGAQLWSSPAGGSGVLVVGTESPDVVELWDWSMMPGDTHGSPAHSAGTKELLQVQAGSLTVSVGGESITLSAGDALSFAGDVDHSYSQVGRSATRFTLTVFEPGVGLGTHPKADHA